MNRSELKKLNRAELLTMLMSVTQRCDDLEEELASAHNQLQQRRIEIENAGSMAEAAIGINQVFAAADQAAQHYLESLRASWEEQESVNRKLLEVTREECSMIEEQTRQKCEEMIAAAKEESQAYWDEVYDRMQQYCSTVEPLRILFERAAAG